MTPEELAEFERIIGYKSDEAIAAELLELSQKLHQVPLHKVVEASGWIYLYRSDELVMDIGCRTYRVFA